MRECLLKLIRQNKLIKRMLTHVEKIKKKYGPNWYQENRVEQKAEANKARNNQATKLIDYDRRWDSTGPYIILGVREVSTFSEIKNQYKFLSKNIIMTLQLKKIQTLLRKK